MFRIAYSVALAVTAALATPALGQRVSSDQQACFDPRVDQPADLDNRMATCSGVIGDSSLGPEIRATAYIRRALAYAQKAGRLHRKEETGRAVADLSTALGLTPYNPTIRRYIHHTRGRLYFHRGDYDDALADYTILIQLEPNSATPYDYRGLVYAAKGETDRAIADFTEALRFGPNVAEIYNHRAWAYLQAQKTGEALADAEKAVMIAPGYAAFYRTRAEIYRALGKSSEAIADLGKALSLNPTDEDIKEELRLARSMRATPRDRKD